MRAHVRDVAAVWLASGLDPQRTILFGKSAVPEVFESAWVPSCLFAEGEFEPRHACKDALATRDAPNAGISNYPVSLASDRLLYDSDLVPTGKPRNQYAALYRDVASDLPTTEAPSSPGPTSDA
jgi:tryptophanyl-tRNA synthetase